MRVHTDGIGDTFFEFKGDITGLLLLVLYDTDERIKPMQSLASITAL